MTARQLAVASCGTVLAAALLQAGQARPVTDGVYSAGQAARGEPIYRAQCGDCHGRAMEGAIGPPLVGDGFLANWSARPVGDIVDRIQKTMPFEKPGSLSLAQSADVMAYVLQAGKFPAGPAELGGETLARVVFPTVSAPPVAAPEGNLAELMRAIAFPNANIIFNLQVKDPAAARGKPLATSPFDYVEWGSTVYPGWLAVDQAAVALTETAALLLTPGRRCQNGKVVPVDRADWKQYVAAMVDVGKLARQASRARKLDAFVEISEKLNDACANCHKVYRDKGGAEGSGALQVPVGGVIMRRISVTLAALVLFVCPSLFAQEWIQYVEQGGSLRRQLPERAQSAGHRVCHRIRHHAAGTCLQRRPAARAAIRSRSSTSRTPRRSTRRGWTSAGRRAERATPVTNDWRADVQGSMIFASWKFLQRNAKVTHFRMGRRRSGRGPAAPADQCRRLANVRRDQPARHPSLHSRGHGAARGRRRRGCFSSRSCSLDEEGKPLRYRAILHDRLLGALEVPGARPPRTGRRPRRAYGERLCGSDI